MKTSRLFRLDRSRGLAFRVITFASLLVAVSSIPAQSPVKGQCSSPEGESQNWTLIEDSKSYRLCVDPMIDWREYEGVQIDPSAFAPSTSKKPLKPKEIQKLTSYLDVSLKDAYKNHPTGSTSLTIKPTITDATRSRPAVNVVGMLAIPVVVSYGGAAIRYVIADTSTGQTIAVLTDTRKGRFYDVPEGLSSLGHSRIVLKRSARQLRKGTDRLRTLAPSPRSSMALNQSQEGLNN